MISSTVLAIQDIQLNLSFSQVSWGLAFAILVIILLFRGDNNKGTLVGYALAIAVVLAILAGWGFHINLSN